MGGALRLGDDLEHLRRHETCAASRRTPRKRESHLIGLSWCAVTQADEDAKRHERRERDRRQSGPGLQQRVPGPERYQAEAPTKGSDPFSAEQLLDHRWRPAGRQGKAHALLVPPARSQTLPSPPTRRKGVALYGRMGTPPRQPAPVAELNRP